MRALDKNSSDATASLPAEDAARTRVRARRELTASVLLALVGGALVLWSSTHGWAHIDVVRAAPLPVQHATVSGKDIAGWANAMGFVGLAGGIALLATKAWGRLAVGSLLALAGCVAVLGGVVGLTATADSPHETQRILPQWPTVTLGAGLLLVIAGALSLWRYRYWRGALAGMGRRYDSPAAVAVEGSKPRQGVDQNNDPHSYATTPAPGRAVESDPARMWDALDRGEDPTS